MVRSRRLFLLVTSPLLALLLLAIPASAGEIGVYTEADPPELCSDVTLTGHVVDGGCHVEFEGNVWLYGHLPAETPVFTCDWHIEARLDGTGEGYATSEAPFEAATGGPAGVPCLRNPCDEADGTVIPWPVHTTEAAPGDERVEMTLCIRQANQAPGTAGGSCKVHLALGGPDHSYTLGSGATHSFCEVSPFPFPVSFTFGLATDGESAEIVHQEE